MSWTSTLIFGTQGATASNPVELCHHVLAHLREGVVLLDMEGRMAYLNAAAERLLGRTAEEALGRPFVDGLDPNRLDELFAGFQSVVGGHPPDAIRSARLRRGEEAVPVEIRLLPYRNDRNEVIEIIGLIAETASDDSAASGELHRRLERSERFFRESIAALKRRTRVLESLLQLTRGVRTDQPIASIHQHFREACASLFELTAVRVLAWDAARNRLEDGGDPLAERVLAEGERVALPDLSRETEYRPMDARNRSAALLPLRVGGLRLGLLQVESAALNAFAEEDLALLELFANHLALSVHTARLFRETRLQQLYREAIIENAGAAIVILDASACIRSLNQMAVHLFALDRDRAVGRPMQEAIQARANPIETQRLLDGLANEEGVANLEFTLRGGDGQMHHALINLMPLDLPEHDPEYILIGHDISRLRQMEMQMIQSEKLASLGQMAAGLAHELGNPITFITSYAQIWLEEPQLGEAHRGRLRKILEATGRIEALIRNLLSYARPGDPQERFPVNLGELIGQTLDFVEHQIRRAQATVERRLSPQALSVMANRGMLQQMLVNLIENALHAVAPKEGRVEIQTERLENGEVQIIIRDNGVGIRPEHLSQVFKPFFTTKPEGKGTGLGLAIVHQIVGAHEGRIAVRSKVGEGTEFRIVLPGL